MVRMSGALLVAVLAPLCQAQIDFTGAVNYKSPTSPEQTVMGDWNNDTFLDLAVTSDSPDKVTIFMNTGDGTFGAGVDVLLANGSSPTGITSADFDGDLDVDIAVTRQNLDDIQLLVNDGSGSFSLGVVYPVGKRPVDITAHRIDGDPTIDLAVLNRDGDSITVLLNRGDGTFSSTIEYPLSVGSNPRELVAADLDTDGDIDLAAAAHDSSAIEILVNNGGGAFFTGPVLSVGSIKPEGVVAADFDGDGDNDLASAGSDGGQDFVSIFIQSTPGTFVGPTDYPTLGVDSGSMVAGDFDLDDDIDVATVNKTSGDVTAIPNTGDGTFGTALPFTVDSGPEHLAAGDLDNNGSIDLVSTNKTGNDVSVLINVYTSGFTDLGNALAGTNGLPTFEGVGTLKPASHVTLRVGNGLPGASGFLVLGLTPINAAFAGGVFVPSPDFLIQATLDGAGGMSIDAVWPNTIPAGTTIYFQVWLIDSGGVDGFAATNAVLGVAQ